MKSKLILKNTIVPKTKGALVKYTGAGLVVGILVKDDKNLTEDLVTGVVILHSENTDNPVGTYYPFDRNHTVADWVLFYDKLEIEN